MSSEEHTQQAAEAASSPRTTDRPPSRLVRHCFWKYPLLSVVLLVVVALLAFFVGSPNWPRVTIAQAAQKDPAGAVLAFTQELDGTSSSASNAQEYGMGDPGQVFVLDPLHQSASLLGPAVQSAVETYD